MHLRGTTTPWNHYSASEHIEVGDKAAPCNESSWLRTSIKRQSPPEEGGITARAISAERSEGRRSSGCLVRFLSSTGQPPFVDLDSLPRLFLDAIGVVSPRGPPFAGCRLVFFLVSSARNPDSNLREWLSLAYLVSSSQILSTIRAAPLDPSTSPFGV
ncbi:hypothetical protein R1flu_021407 [Riccia fluitans]|uniref:Uncharacterized protein n=1 Tax=Riccia fluitans TaxID=41844 RepID=A0ABD1ZP95_9MARC